jgi:hypothetical protein
VLHFNVGEVVERREFSNTTRGTVVNVTANGYVAITYRRVRSISFSPTDNR